ncbi:MAG: GTPase Era [Lachnospiraceae bacterium]|nr:GTPase Era [Lachnospiraceae bacterium]
MEKVTRSGFVTLIGRPNVGKSTLMNHLIGQKIAITSSKPQTTRNKIQTVYTDERGQVIFLDTPGIHKAQNKLGEFMVKIARDSLDEVDLIMWLVEPSTFIGAGERSIIEQLRSTKTPVILVINKIDTVKKEVVASAIEAYKNEYDFAEIIPVSASKKTNTDELMRQVFNYLPYGPLYYDEDTVTDQPERDIVGELIREKSLRLLGEEVPHGIAVLIDSMKERHGEKYDFEEKPTYDVEATIICERESHKGIIIGKQGSMLKKIGTQARKDAEKLLDCNMNLKLWVKVKKDWRDSDSDMKNYGYYEKKDR